MLWCKVCYPVAYGSTVIWGDQLTLSRSPREHPLPSSKSSCICHFIFVRSHASDRHHHTPTLCYRFSSHLICPLCHRSCHTLNSNAPPHSTHGHHKSFVLKHNLRRCGLTLDAISPPCTAMDFVGFWFTHSLIVLFFWHACFLTSWTVTPPVLSRVFHPSPPHHISPSSHFPIIPRSFLCLSPSSVFVYLLLDWKVSDKLVAVQALCLCKYLGSDSL